MYKKKSTFILLSAVLLLRLAAAPVIISVPEDATPVEKRAAAELAVYLKKIYNSEFEVKTNAPDAAIKVGAFKKSPANLGNDGFEIVSDRKTLSICGGTRRGTGNLYGVYEYLERIGVRFLTRTEEYIPKKDKFELLKLNVKEKPSFEFMRRVISSGRFWTKMRNTTRNPRWKKKNLASYGLFRQPKPHGHSMFSFMPPKKYAKTHPEYYAVHKNRRSFDKMVGQLCLTNEEMTKEFIKNCKAYLKKEYTPDIILTLTPQDNKNHCDCPRCDAVLKEEGSHSGTLVRFINKVAEALTKDYPDLLIVSSGYQLYRIPPRKTSYHKNVIISHAIIECDFAKAFSGSPRNEEFRKLMTAWKKRCSMIRLTDYGATFDTYQLPLPNFDALAERYKFIHANNYVGVSTINAHTSPGGEFNDLRNYVTSRLLWNVNADPWEIADDFCRHYYGKGGKYLLDYIKWYHKYLKEKNASYHIGRNPEHLYDEHFVSRAETAFQKAYAASGKNKVIRRRLDYAYTTVQMMRVLLLKRTKPQSAAFKKAVDDLDKACRRFKITAKNESKTSMRDFLEEMRFTIPETPEFCKGKVWIAGIPQAYCRLNWAKMVDDPKAVTKKAVRLNTWHKAWAVYKNLMLPGFNTPVRYDAYVKIRVVPMPGAKPTDRAFGTGVNISKGNSRPRVILLKDTSPDEYRYIRIAENFPITNSGKVWIAPVANPKVIKHIFVDHFIFVRTADAED